MTSKRIKATIVTVALAACLVVSGVAAYLTDADKVTNEFEYGKVSIDLQELSFDEDAAVDLEPGAEIAKDPKIVNTGSNQAYVFMKVEIPADTVDTANAAGAAQGEAFQELFLYNVNAGWVELDAYKVVGSNSVTHVYAYAAADETLTALAKNAETATLFNHVKLINTVEGEIDGLAKQIEISAYAIQTNHLGDASAIDGTTTTLTDASDVWDILVTVDPSLEQGTEDPSTDVIQ